MANSLTVGCLKVGMNVSVCVPEGYEPAANILEFAKSYGSAFELVREPLKAAGNADVLVTDVWASMGKEGEAEKRKKDFAGFQINDETIKAAKPDVMVLHCLPAHKGEEITEKVFEEHANAIFDESENRLHAQKAVMVKLMT
jgi:ornithine carbamoyltransferase